MQLPVFNNIVVSNSVNVSISTHQCITFG